MSRRHNEKPRRPSRLTIPTGVGPHVKLVFSEMRRQNISYDECEWRSGVLRTTCKAWRTKTRPGLETIEAVLGTLGWTLTPIPTETVLPAEVVRELRPVAEKLGLTMPEAMAAVAEIVAGVHDRFPPEAVHKEPAPLVRPRNRPTPDLALAA